MSELVASRRIVLGAVGASAVLAACGGGTEAPQGTANPTPEPPDPTNGGGGGGSATVPASDVPVGSGVISDQAKVVFTQPTAGEYKAFDWTCTHKGCPVKKVEGDTISCPCHGSQFSIADGSVKNGPAASSLTELKVSEDGGELTVER